MKKISRLLIITLSLAPLSIQPATKAKKLSTTMQTILGCGLSAVGIITAYGLKKYYDHKTPKNNALNNYNENATNEAFSFLENITDSNAPIKLEAIFKKHPDPNGKKIKDLGWGFDAQYITLLEFAIEKKAHHNFIHTLIQHKACVTSGIIQRAKNNKYDEKTIELLQNNLPTGSDWLINTVKS